MQQRVQWTLAGAALIAAAALCVIAVQGTRGRSLPELSTPYHAVALMNGQDQR